MINRNFDSVPDPVKLLAFLVWRAGGSVKLDKKELIAFGTTSGRIQIDTDDKNNSITIRTEGEWNI